MKNICDWKNCNKIGAFKAPVEKDNSKKYRMLCLNHVKEFNKNWNYFEGMNDNQIYEFLKKNDAFDKSQTIDDLVGDFKKIEDDGLVRCIAQNFTTQWFKIFNDVEKIPCTSCNTDAYLGKEESRICPNSDCNATL